MTFAGRTLRFFALAIPLLAASLQFSAAPLLAQSTERVLFRTRMLPQNEVPAVTDFNGSATADVTVSLVRDSSGQIASGSVQFNLAMTLDGNANFVAMHIHRGAAGTNGPVVIDSSLRAVSGGGTLRIQSQGQVAGDNATGLAALRDLLQDPSQFYVNLHTSSQPGGAVRGQLARAETLVLMTTMNPRNEVPAIADYLAYGAGVTFVYRTRDGAGVTTTASISMATAYRFPAAATISGFHIHEGARGANGPVVLNSRIPAQVASSPNGVGTISTAGNLELTTAAELGAVDRLFANPGNFYLNLHTTDYPGGVIRGQLLRPGRLTFPLTMSPANEVPAITDLNASGLGLVEALVLRAPDGSVIAGQVIYDVNYRFPGAVTFTGFHIHDGAAGVNGPVRLDSGLTAASGIASESGAGNITISAGPFVDGPALNTLDSLVQNPDRHYLNLHTTANPGGALRSQLQAPVTNAPRAGAILSSALLSGVTNVAPGGLMTIFGLDLAKAASDLGGFDSGAVPLGLNGVVVEIAGRRSPLLYVSPFQINAQVPADAPVGRQVLAINNGVAPSIGYPVTVAGAAPAIFATQAGPLVSKMADGSLVTALNAATAGDVLMVYSTGLGATGPNGALTAMVLATVGGQPATVMSSAQTPGAPGVYQTMLRVPAGLTAGLQPLVLQIGSVVSNTVQIAIR